MIDPSKPVTPKSTNETKPEASKPSPDPAKATSPANIKATFGTPKKQ